MSSAATKTPPPDQRERERALDSARSVLVQAPAGSGKTDLLTRRFLRLLGEAGSPSEIVAITFTNAAAAEMRHRILAELEKAANSAASSETERDDSDSLSMEVLARRAFDRSLALGWNLLDSPSQLRISTIDSFCRELALQQPLLSQLGSGFEITENPQALYRRAARRTLERIDDQGTTLSEATAALLDWRDNNWQDLEDQLVKMLEQRDRWMHDFVLDRETDWDALRERLERPFANAVRDALAAIHALLDHTPGAREEILSLARFACEEPGSNSPRELAECAEITAGPSENGFEPDCAVFCCLADFLMTQKGEWRLSNGLNKNAGFPATPRGRLGKVRFAALIATLDSISGLQSALAAVRNLPALHYTEDEWRIVRASFTLLRHAAAELQVVFAESGSADYTEVAQTALHALRGEEGLPTEAALSIADQIHHILVDEFQDTSRRQHDLLRHLVAAWPEREARTCFVVGDPMQSIYSFRDADAELFPRVREVGLEIPGAEPLRFDFVPLSANFRTTPVLVEELNNTFGKIFAAPGGGIVFSPAKPMRSAAKSDPRFQLHLDFTPQSARDNDADRDDEKGSGSGKQTDEIVSLIRGYAPAMEAARALGERYRIAILGRARKSLASIAQALREAGIPFRAVDLEQLAQRPEVQDALALARALLNPEDRVAWLGVMRAPWCGLSLADLHAVASDDDPELLARAIPDLLTERRHLLSPDGQVAVARLLHALEAVPALRAALPNAALGTWLEQIWLRLGGADCVEAHARANLDLLWSCLDKLPNGEQDLLSPTLDAALEKLTALPDPSVSSECGVQLMTIHKAKGLEFEVVIVPGVEARGGSRGLEMLSWLERGIAPDAGTAESGEITEFLIAPFQPKGDKRGEAKGWVDRVRSDREAQEDRRILYVAATRAREELHLFAQPSYKTESNGSLTLCEPKNNLLATAWPALEDEVRASFDAWRASRDKDEPAPAEIESIAAGAATSQDNLVVLPSPVVGTRLRRLPPDYRVAKDEGLSRQSDPEIAANTQNTRLFERHEGGLLSRALGRAIHAMLERLAHLCADRDWDSARTMLSSAAPQIAAELRATGIEPKQAADLAGQAFEIALKASRDPVGQWILSPHSDAASELRWTGVIDGSLRTVQADRVFRAGASPQSEGNDCWWIIDYKSVYENFADSAALLSRLRPLFAPQLEAYAVVLRNLHGADAPIRAGLYYPRMSLLDWWEI